jgi:hypothetical protein
VSLTVSFPPPKNVETEPDKPRSIVSSVGSGKLPDCLSRQSVGLLIRSGTSLQVAVSRDRFFAHEAVPPSFSPNKLIA